MRILRLISRILIAITLILCITGTVIGIKNNNFKEKYDVSNIQVTAEDKTARESKQSSFGYDIVFKLKISSLGKAGIRTLKVQYKVYYKIVSDNSELMTVSSDLNLDVAAGDSQSVDCVVFCRNLDDEKTQKLYDTNYSDLKFVFTIISARFDDGQFEQYQSSLYY